jgi:hypothetical protein
MRNKHYTKEAVLSCCRNRGWKMMLNLLIVISTAFSASAQVSTYVFSQSTGTYTPLSASRTIVFTATANATSDPGLGDDQNYTLAAGTIPFTFTFNGTSYTGVNINSNGYLTFGATLPTSSDRSGISNTTAWNASIVAHGADLSANTNSTNLGEISWEVTGTAPNRSFVIQFAKWRRFSSSSTFTENYNFQFRLNEGGGVSSSQTVDIIYGACVSTSTSATCQVGLRGPNATFASGNVNNRQNPSTAWNASIPGTSNTSSMRHTTTVNPVSGQIFTWAPPTPCTGTPTAGTATSTGISCGSATGNVTLTLTGSTSGVSGIAYQWQSSPDNSSWSNIAGGTSNPYTTTVPLPVGTFIRGVVTCTPSSTSAISNVVQIGDNCLKYDITRSSATYTPVSGGATIVTPTTGTSDDTNFGPFTFFPFSYAGQTVTQFRVCTNGFMTLNNANSSTTFNNGLTNTTSNNMLLCPFYEDLFVNNGTPNSQFVKYEITGSTPNRVLTVEWNNVEVFNYPGPSLNFQAKLFESDSHIEYVYGVMQGFDGTNPNNGSVTNGYAFSYTVGMNGTSWGTPALAGQAIGLQQANSLSFSSLGGVTNNEGINKLSVMPECGSKYVFTPFATVRPNDPAPGVPTAPSNDDPNSPIVLTTLPSTPSNFCGSFYSSAFATPTMGVASEIAGTNADDDVWFEFNAISTNTTITLRGSGGYDAAMQIFNEGDLNTVLAEKNANGLTGTSLTETINQADFNTVIGQNYLVRVYHALGGNQAKATANISSGAITSFTITDGGTGYITCNGGSGITATPFVYITDPSGEGAVAKVTVSGGAITAITIQGGQAGTNYTAPDVTIAPPGFGVTGDFSIIVNATPPPPCIANPTAPANGGTVCSSNSVTLSWPASSGATGYDVYFDNGAGTTLVSSNQPGLTYAAGVLPVGTYSWKIIPQSAAGVSSGCNTWTFIVADPATAGTISGPSALFAGQNGSFSEAGGSGGTLTWKYGTVSGTHGTSAGTGNPQNISFPGPGTYYLVAERSVGGCTTAVSNELTIAVTLQGDNTCAPIVISTGYNGPFSNVGATTQPGERTPPGVTCTGQTSWCSGQTISNTIWLSFVAPASGRISIHFSPGDWDSQIALWSAASCSGLTDSTATLIAANDDSSGSSPFNAFIDVTCVTPGQTYYVQVDGFSSTTNSNIGIVLTDEGSLTWYADADGDTYGNPLVSLSQCTQPAGYVSNSSDCNDGNSAINPAATEVCDGVDNNCNGQTDEGFDLDGDGYTSCNGDCNDNNAAINPGASEVCDGIDNDCDTFIDDADPSVSGQPTWYADADGDGYGNLSSTTLACVQPAGYVANSTDCNDGNSAINPGATEVCDGIDNNCNGQTDEGFDLDGDGYTSCNGDCNDNNAAINPGASEVCDGIDNDCDGLTDSADPSVIGQATWYADTDGDGYGNAMSSVQACTQPAGYVANSTDCDDLNAAVNPGATEVCNGIDDDCDGSVDEGTIPGTGIITGSPINLCWPSAPGIGSYTVSSIPNATAYTWSVPSGMFITGGQGTQTITIQWTAAGINPGIIGNVSVIASNACGAGPASTLAVALTTVKPVTPGSVSGPTKLCPGDAGVYSVAPVARASYYSWTVPAGVTIVGSSSGNIINVTVDGSFTGGTISVSAGNPCGDGPVRTRAVSLNLPVTPGAITGQATGVCGNTGEIYSIAAVSNANSYLWTVGAGGSIPGSSTGLSVAVDYNGSLSSTVLSVSSVNGCGSSSARTLTVTGAPGLPSAITGATSVCTGGTNHYSVNTVVGATSYAWTAPGTIINGQGSKEIDVTWGASPSTGQQITVRASNACGNGPLRTLSGVNVNFCPRIGTSDLNADLNAYPNPATDVVTISFNTKADYTLKLIDVTGRVVTAVSNTASGNQTELLNLKGLNSGVYMVVLETANGTEQVRLFVD